MSHRLVCFSVELPASVADWIEAEAELSGLQPQDVAASLLSVSAGAIREARAERALAAGGGRFSPEGTSNTFRNVSN